MERFMKWKTTILMGALLCAACAQIPVLDDASAPIHAINPPEMPPMARAWVGQEEISLGLDTGSEPAVILFADTVKELGGRIRGKGTVRTTSLDVTLNPPSGSLDTPTYVVDAPGAPCQGLIGWETIRKYVWNINIPDLSHGFTCELPPGISRWNSFAIRKNGTLPHLNIPGYGSVVLDTGAPFAVYLSPAKWAAFKQKYPHLTPITYSGYSPAAGGYFVKECVYVDHYSVGKLSMRNVVICENFADPKTMGMAKAFDIMLGSGALAEREFWLDGPGGKLYFSRLRSLAPAPNGLNLVGVTFIPKQGDGPPYVAVVANNSPAWQAGLRSGDLLLQIDGNKEPSLAYLDQVTTQPGSSAQVLVKRRNHILDVQWNLPPTIVPSSLTPPAQPAQEPPAILPGAAAATANPPPAPDNATPPTAQSAPPSPRTE